MFYILKRSIFLCFFSFLLLTQTLSYAEETLAATEPKKAIVLKVSEEAIASLTGQLSEEQFDLLKDKLLGQHFAQLDLSQLIPPTETEDAEQRISFSDEDMAKVRNSLTLYFEILGNIQLVAPLVKSSHTLKEKIKGIESALDGLMKKERETAEIEISDLKTQLENHSNSFKVVASQFDLENINFDRLPGMLADLGYEDMFYDVMHEALSTYIGHLKKVSNVQSIIDSLVEISDVTAQTEKKLRSAQTEEEKTAIAVELKKLRERKNNLQHDFTLTTTGIDTAALDEKTSKKINAEEELTKIFSPLIVGLTKFTEPVRRIEFLRSNITYYEQHVPKMRKGMEELDVLLVETQDETIKTRLMEERVHWEQQEKEFSAKLEVAKQQLIELENRKLSPLDAFDHFVQAVFSKRGFNIIFAVLIFFLTFIGMLLLRRLILLINPFNYIPKLHFIASLLDVALYLLSFIVATLVLMVSLYAAGEILALAIVTLILFGMAWAVRSALPKFVEQIKLLLGYGPVRQGERIIHEGIAWRVESIGIYSYLKNPLLTGGTLRLPVKDLIDMRSRPYDEEKETWFPCREEDYIVFVESKVWRKVAILTPQRITFDWYGVPETMPTTEFLEQRLLNLSRGPFWVGINFEIAYKHRHEILDKVLGQLETFLGEEFKSLPFFGERFLYPWVDVAGFTEASVTAMVWVQLESSAAEKYPSIAINMRRICLKAANTYDWEIKRFYAIEQEKPDGFDSSVKTVTTVDSTATG
ncbi:AAA family ATPase [Candidatus Venteria ishoeyi]|uniref:Mechanosensitive ion channel n=1 Tax=Candidatus Venteria ishoeyi TaxID=1899563 RepID=A0A1H6F3N7_9GAMM|nr:hypothetical protein [Candidatus Venteria ishoeyi]MDM8545650.1 hypothetical protein [Candidatus Venteria ishoeyi]SEH04730.1 Uncharacterised protein [Candidatus Venteria ishoeyi]